MPACHGDGRAITNRPDALPAPVRAAFEYVGGRAGFVDGEPGVVLAHFRDASATPERRRSSP